MKYPNGIKQKVNKVISYKNRGMELEKEINISNQYYIDNNIAFIYKKPTPIQIKKVDYPNRKSAVIREAFFKEPSTTDYNGLYKGLYIDFEAKETNNLTSFPLNNIHSHQIQHIKNITNNNGICFLIVRFNKLNKTYLLLGKDFIAYISDNVRKSVPLSYFEEKAYILEEGYNPRINYIKILDLILEVQINGTK